jgi:hypothetical protein
MRLPPRNSRPGIPNPSAGRRPLPSVPHIYGWGQTNPALAAGAANIKPPGAGTPGAPAAAPAQPQTPSAPDVRDPTSFTDLASLEQHYQNQKAGLGAQSTQDQLAVQRAMQMLGEQQPRDAQTLKQNENTQGLFYSGDYGQKFGDLETSYAQKRQAQTEGFQSREGQRALQSQDLEANYGPNGILRTGALNTAVDRQAQRDLTYGVPVDQPATPQSALAAQIVQRYAAPQAIRPPSFGPRRPQLAAAKARPIPRPGFGRR